MGEAFERLLVVAMASLVFSGAAAQGAGVTVQTLLTSGRVLDHQSVIVDTGHPDDAGMCRGFDLTDSEIREFFKNAAVTSTAGTAPHPPLWAPCQVEGHFLYQGEKFWFSISAASTAVIEVAPGDYADFACPTACRSLFYYGYGATGDDG
jgi:hypothetical protein